MAAINIGRQIVSSRKDEPFVGTPTGNSVVHAPSPGNDEIYRDLSTFTFGAARPTAPSPSPSYDADIECDNMISPLTPIPPRVSVDRTPRSSVVAVTQGYSSYPPYSRGYERILPLPPPPPSARRPYRDPDYRFSGIRFGTDNDPHDSDDVDARPNFTRDRDIAQAQSRALDRSRDPPISDTASQHTFGGRGLNSSSVSVSSVATSSKAHSRASSRLDFSSDDEGGYVYRSNHASDWAQPSFTRNEIADMVDEDDEIDFGLGHGISSEHLYGRRGSLPMPIPGASSTKFTGDDRESNLASLRRPSRSLDDTSVSGLTLGGSSGLKPRSEPLSKGDWVTLEAHAHAQQQNDNEGQDPLAGLNLGYILGGQDISGYRRSSDALSYVQPLRKSSQSRQSFSFALGWNSLAGRRSSTATNKSGPDDTFLRHLNKCNEGYGVQTGTWTFKKEKADGSSRNVWSAPGANAAFTSPRGSFSESHRQVLEGKNKIKEKSTLVNIGMTPGTQEIWKCEVVGRFKVDRQTYRPDPTKPPHQRVNVRHILDPYSRGNTRGGPSITIHKHSRAIAFSIYRAHNLTDRHRLRPGILLAPKKVQERFTSTKTTAKLVTHGLLEERESGQNAHIPSRTSSLGRRDKDRHKSGDGAKAKSKLRSDKGNENRTGHVAKDSARSYDMPTLPKDVPVSDVTNTGNRSSSDGITVTEEQQDFIADDSYSRIESTSDQSTVKSLYQYRDSLDVDCPPSRTPHAETYGTLDSSIIEYVRMRPDRPVEPDSNTSFFKRLLRPLPRSTMPASSHTAGLTSAQLEGNYKPPWMAMAPRAKQEETDRVIHNLNNSFKGVGLLPANAKPISKSKKPPNQKNRLRVNILEHVPEDSLYMLLPLWPGETDPLSSPGARSDSSPVPILEDRHYLLVYYVPRLEKSKEDHELSKRRSRSSQTSSSESANLPDDRNIILSEFHVCARLVSYNELRGSGVRLPSDGLSVTGPMWEAAQSIPDPAILLGRQSDWVIALYHGRERGVELMPDGLMKLGLCLPVTPPLPPVYPLEEEETEEVQEPLLSPMGRAAVEMAWAGCIALSSFGPT